MRISDWSSDVCSSDLFANQVDWVDSVCCIIHRFDRGAVFHPANRVTILANSDDPVAVRLDRYGVSFAALEFETLCSHRTSHQMNYVITCLGTLAAASKLDSSLATSVGSE